jgi:hypothetical protein
MSDKIELHDSWVAAEQDGRVLVLRLCPAYVHHWEQIDGHWVGEGRSQTAEITLTDGTLEPYLDGRLLILQKEEPSVVSDGWLEVDGQRYDNILPVSLSKIGAVRGRLELIGAPAIEFSALGIEIRLLGESKFVESLPPEWAPDREAG